MLNKTPRVQKDKANQKQQLGDNSYTAGQLHATNNFDIIQAKCQPHCVGLVY